jgi:hypothetical protein
MQLRHAGGHVTEISDPSDAIFTCGVSAGAVWYSLRDLVEKASRLPPGGLKETWVTAAKEMMATLNEAQDTAKLG